MASILVVDADSALRASIAAELNNLGHSVSEADSAEAAIKTCQQQRTDLALVECELPDGPGIDVLDAVKRRESGSNTRIVMTGERRRFSDLAAAFESGADDVVAKPIDMDELVARVQTCLRRPPVSRSPGELRVGGITIDSVGQRVSVNGDPAVLAPREYHLLLFFLENRERVFSRDQLLSEVWGKHADVGARTVDVHVRRLRSLLEPYGYEKFLQTVRGSGYRFSPHPEQHRPPPAADDYDFPDAD